MSDTESKFGAPITFLSRIDRILLGFFRGFYAQERLFEGIVNELRYSAGGNGLKISQADATTKDDINHVPSIILQSGGVREEMIAIDNRSWHSFAKNYHKTSYRTIYSAHCMAATLGQAKLLATTTMNALIAYRRVIYEHGVDNISAVSLTEPQKLSPENDAQGVYVISVMFEVRSEWDWSEEESDGIEQKIVVGIEAAIQCPPDDDDTDKIVQQIQIDNSESP